MTIGPIWPTGSGGGGGMSDAEILAAIASATAGIRTAAASAASPAMAITVISSGGLYSDLSGYTTGTGGTIAALVAQLKKEGFHALTLRAIWPQIVSALPNPTPVINASYVAKVKEFMLRCKLAGLRMRLDLHTLVVNSVQQSTQAPTWLHHIAPQTQQTAALTITGNWNTVGQVVTLNATGAFPDSLADFNMIVMQNSDPSTGGVIRITANASADQATGVVEQAATSGTWSSNNWYATRRHILDIFISSTSTDPRKDAVRNAYRDYAVALVDALKTDANWDVVEWVSPFNEIWLTWNDALSPERFTSGAKPTYQALRTALSGYNTKLAVKFVPEWNFWSPETNKKYQIDEFIDLIDVYGVHPYWRGLKPNYANDRNGAWDDACSVGTSDGSVKYVDVLRRMAADLLARNKGYEWTECGTNNSDEDTRNRHLYETMMRALTPGFSPDVVTPWVCDIGGGDSAFQTGSVQTFNCMQNATTFATGWLENTIRVLRGPNNSNPVVPITGDTKIDRRFTRFPVPVTMTAAGTLRVLSGRLRPNETLRFINNTPQYPLTLVADDFDGTGASASCNLYRRYRGGDKAPVVRTAAYGTGTTSLITTCSFTLRADDSSNIELIPDLETTTVSAIPIGTINNGATSGRFMVSHPVIVVPDFVGSYAECDTEPDGTAAVTAWEIIAVGSGYPASTTTSVRVEGFLDANRVAVTGNNRPSVDITTDGAGVITGVALTPSGTTPGGVFVHAPAGFRTSVSGGTGGIVRASSGGSGAVDKTVRSTVWAYPPGNDTGGSVGCVQIGSDGLGRFTTSYTADFGTPTYPAWTIFPAGTTFALNNTRVSGSYANLRFGLLLTRP